jgi:uncharacterized peroxidase-related enzyme
MASHAAALRLRTKNPRFVDRLIANYRQVDLDPRDQAMLDFAVRLTREPEASTEEHLARLRDVGFKDEEILHIAELTAIFNYNGRLANALGLMPNREYHDLGRDVGHLAD